MRVPYSCRKDALCVGVVPTQLSLSLSLCQGVQEKMSPMATKNRIDAMTWMAMCA
jgi:hypothetical protein